MHQTLQVGIIGDYHEMSRVHTATNDAVQHAADALTVSVKVTWLPTPMLAGDSSAETLRLFDALWCAPGSPYQSMQGALHAIRFAREQAIPFIGT